MNAWVRTIKGKEEMLMELFFWPDFLLQERTFNTNAYTEAPGHLLVM